MKGLKTQILFVECCVIYFTNMVESQIIPSVKNVQSTDKASFHS